MSAARPATVLQLAAALALSHAVVILGFSSYFLAVMP